jgi:hypothetical protein
MPAPSFSEVATALLEAAGGTYSMAEAASLLGITADGLQRQIQDSRVLGVALDDGIILVPKLQFADGGVLPGIDRLTAIFNAAKASGWTQLQFLVYQDPNLARLPIEALRDGDVEGVEHAARAHLHLDEC